MKRESDNAKWRHESDGDGYTGEWLDDAAKLGLPNLVSTPEALEVLNSQKAKDLFAKYGVLSNEELESRYNTYKETYETLIAIEADTAARIAKTMIIPSVVTAISEYSGVPAVAGIAGEMSSLLEQAVSSVAVLEAAGEAAGQIEAMNELRVSVDALEALVPADLWPMPTYAEMLFI